MQRIVILYEGGNEFLPKSDILVIKQGENRVEFPYEKIGEIECDKFSLVDEEQYLVDTLTEKEYSEFFKSASLMMAEPSSQFKNQNVPPGDSTKNKWWKFW